MIRMLTCGLCTCGLITARAALLAAPGQTYPGQPTRANVWIENRSKSEAVPVVIQNGEGDAPLRVQLIGLPTVALSPATVVQSRAIRQTWEYKEVTAPSVQRAIVALNAAGLEGWEPIASPVPTPDGMSWLLKRPR
jgi:hypothetical protein